MPLFNTSQPQQYYSRQVSPQTTGEFYNPGELTPVRGGNRNDIASYFSYGAAVGAIAGTQGYRLPAQSYYNYGINNPSNYGTGTLKTTLVDTAINGALTGLIYGLTGGPSTDPTNGRLSGTGVQQGATPAQLLQAATPRTNPDDGKEDRVVIYDQTGQFIGQSAIFQQLTKPLKELGGVLFPYTPTISVNHRASYEMMHLVHTNYSTPAYQYSSIESITLQALFTANYRAEAEYIIAMLHFFRSATKMFYGQDQLAGTPPPILFLDGYGPWTFDHIPVVITSFDYTLPNDVDYISCTVLGERQKVPTTLNVSLNMVPTYSRNKISNEFGLTKYSQGQLKTSGRGYRSGGWI